MATKFKTVDEYISSFPKSVQESLQIIRKTIKEEIPQAEEVISYQLPTFKLHGKNIIYYSAWKNHFSLYPFPNEMENDKEAASYITSGKGTIQFPIDKPLSLSLIRKITQHLVKKHETSIKSEA